MEHVSLRREILDKTMFLILASNSSGSLSNVLKCAEKFIPRQDKPKLHTNVEVGIDI
jgi:hypothetical protein